MAGTKVAAGILAALITSATVAGVAFAHGDGGYQAPAYGMGTGMMGGHGMGPGMMGGQGMGPGMMGGYGMGPGMMGGQGMGPGMGSQGMGPGMMGSQGMGPGMMGGQGMGPGVTGGQGMGPGVTGGRPTDGVELDGDQRKQMAAIHSGLRKQHWALQGQIMEARDQLFVLYGDETPDPKKIGAVYAKIFDLRRQMIEAAIDAQNRQRAVLTAEQREHLRENAHGWGGAYDPWMMHHGFGHHMMGG